MKGVTNPLSYFKMIQNTSITSDIIDPPQISLQTQANTPPEGMRLRKAKTSYMHFINTPENRKAVISEYETTNPGEKIPPKTLVSLLASRWRQLSEVDKQPYQNLFIQEKEKLSSSPEWLPKKQKKSTPTSPASTTDPITSTVTNSLHDLHLQIQHLLTEQAKQQKKIDLLTQIVQLLQRPDQPPVAHVPTASVISN